MIYNLKLKLTTLIVTALVLLMLSSCAVQKDGCPGAHSQGRVPGKFNK